ncbi:MAG: hypothetical protein JSS81_24150 [Acidobacteria bacterium]|nr:hypothetical protein [Acidobacteriota bacterium]
MKTVLVVPDYRNGRNFRAVYGEKESFGKTVGEAVDSLTSQLENGGDETLYVVQRFSPDEFFTADQQQRLAELMNKLHAAQNGAEEFSPAEKTELESLIEAELAGSARRAEKIAKFFQ